MTELTPQRRRTQERFEGLIGLMAPALDLVLGIGDRISRRIEPTDHEYQPVRSASATSRLGPGPERSSED
jgi:hypothetical protein